MHLIIWLYTNVKFVVKRLFNLQGKLQLVLTDHRVCLQNVIIKYAIANIHFHRDTLKRKVHMYNLYISLILFSVFCFGCTTPPPNYYWKQPPPVVTKYNGNYPSEQIRNLWMLCSTGFQQKQPLMELMDRWVICDCYTDTIRSSRSPEELNNMSEQEGADMAQLLINTCNSKASIPINPT